MKAKGRDQLKKNVFYRALPELPKPPLHIGPTLAPEANLCESPFRAHSETKIAQIICQGRDFNHLFYYS